MSTHDLVGKSKEKLRKVLKVLTVTITPQPFQKGEYTRYRMPSVMEPIEIDDVQPAQDDSGIATLPRRRRASRMSLI